jgi:hypothetical protein
MAVNLLLLIGAADVVFGVVVWALAAIDAAGRLH